MKATMSIFLLCIALSSVAQIDKKNMPRATFTVGGSFQQFDGLNSRVANFPQFKTLQDHGGTLGVGWIKDCKRLITSGNFTLGSSMSGDRDKKSSTLHYYSLTADIGYDVLKSQKIMLYPFGGVGYQKYQAIFYRDNSIVSFDEVLQSPTVRNSISSVKFNNPFLVYRAGLGISFQSPKDPSKSIGIKAGYAGSFKDHAWKSNEDQTLANAPIDKVSQFFVGLVLTSSPMHMK